MNSVSEAFDLFRKRLELTKTESEDAQKRHKEVRECIKNDFDVQRDFLTGSYARHTKTKPLKDVDVFFVLGDDENHRRARPPSEILDAFEASLIANYGRERVERGRRCVTVEFEKKNQTQDSADGVLSIDAVPAFPVDNHFDIPDGIIGEWISSNPEVHKEQATAKNNELSGSWVPLVKMIKGWNREAGKPVKPMFLMEVMARELVDPPFNNYPDEFIRFLSAAQLAIDDDWPDPAGLGPNVSDQMDAVNKASAKQKFRDAERLAVQAQHAEKQGRNSVALGLWREIFGNYFPTR
tara:strand:- start:2692 stop:3576 length:885 start_codon:yes stop_codon:yes gene_type:complete